MPKYYEPTIRTVPSNDERYAIKLQVLDERLLTMNDEELIEAMAKYKPRTYMREGDFVLLQAIPEHYMDRPYMPRGWKIRFIVSYWAWNLMRVLTQQGGNISLAQAQFYLEQNKYLHGGKEFHKPMIYAHGYPHGQYPDSAAWLPESLLRRTTHNELTQHWRPIVEESKAPYLGFDRDDTRSAFVLDIAPLQYGKGDRKNNLPFVAEEDLTNELHKIKGMPALLDIPMFPNERDRVERIDPDHDVYVQEDDEEYY